MFQMIDPSTRALDECAANIFNEKGKQTIGDSLCQNLQDINLVTPANAEKVRVKEERKQAKSGFCKTLAHHHKPASVTTCFVSRSVTSMWACITPTAAAIGRR